MLMNWMSRQCKYGGERCESKIFFPSLRMLDEFGAEIDHADTRLDATMKKMAKVLHLSDGIIR